MNKLLVLLSLLISNFTVQAKPYEAEVQLKRFMSMGLDSVLHGVSHQFSACNGFNKTGMLLTQEDDGSVFFTASSKANWHGRGHEPLFPIIGDVFFEVLDEDGTPVSFLNRRGKVKSLTPKSNTFYVVESDYDYEQRKKHGDDCIGEGLEGKFIAEFSFFLNEVKGKFYQVTPKERVMTAQEESSSIEVRYEARVKGLMEFNVKHGNLHRLQRNNHYNNYQNRKYFGR